MKELEQPLDAMLLLKKRRSFTKKLQGLSAESMPLKIAILGGSTTHEVREMLELFLLHQGFKPSFYETGYNQFWEDIMFSPEKLLEFQPDLIYVHTTYRNIRKYPSISMEHQEKERIFQEETEHFSTFWDKLQTTFSCPVIQNNFEQPPYRIYGNQDVVYGLTAMISHLNAKLSLYAMTHSNFFVHDIQYLAADLGLSVWHDLNLWHFSKYALSLQAIPSLAFSLSRIVASLYGKNKKVLVLDLDNTLWGGVVGDDGVENLKLGTETPESAHFTTFQSYIKSLQELGVVLAIASKNNEENAIAGLNHPDSILKPDDFATIHANWHSKDASIEKISEELCLGLDSFVFIDDNPAEQLLVKQSLSMVSVPDIRENDDFIDSIHKNGFFELTNWSQEDKYRQKMYHDNKERKKQSQKCTNYQDYLQSLEMKGSITPFAPVDLQRIAQLTNKTNQFNLSTKRYTQETLAELSDKPEYFSFAGRLSDCFGDNGLVSVVLGKLSGDTLEIDLWLMSCRVLQRNFEFAMMDQVVKTCKEHKIKQILGSYRPTEKNKMVSDFYATMGFLQDTTSEHGETTWRLQVSSYEEKNTVITLE